MRDYEAVLKQARTCANRKYCDLGGNCEYYDLDVCCQGGEKDILKDAADAIEELLAAVPQWVSVGKDQKSPVSALNCLVGYFNGGKYNQLWWYDFVSTDANGVIAPNNTDIEGQCVAVFAMPEPPKEDADNG